MAGSLRLLVLFFSSLTESENEKNDKIVKFDLVKRKANVIHACQSINNRMAVQFLPFHFCFIHVYVIVMLEL